MFGNLLSKLESILFVASKPLSEKKLAAALKVKPADLAPLLTKLESKYDQAKSGVVLLKNDNQWQLVSNPANKDEAEQFLKAEVSGDLTRPQLETLTVVSYCGPITKPELEQIRGVNCGLILRNLMLRGLVEEVENKNTLLQEYRATMDYLRHLGLQKLQDLPDYDELHQHPYLGEAKSIN